MMIPVGSRVRRSEEFWTVEDLKCGKFTSKLLRLAESLRSETKERVAHVNSS